VTSEATSPPPNKMKPEVIMFDFRSAAMTDAANASVASTESCVDDVTEPEVRWDVMESSSPVAPFPVSGSPRLSGLAEHWPTGFISYPSPPDPLSSSSEVKPEVATFNFRSAAAMQWTNGADQSFVSGGSYADDVTVPEVKWYSTSPDVGPYPVGGSSLHPGVAEGLHYTTYPLPDPVRGSESNPGFYIHSEWVPSDTTAASPHDRWLEATRWTTTEDNSWPHPIDNSPVKLNAASNIYSQQKYFDSFPDQSLGGVIYESLEGSSGGYWSYDNDYFEDVMSVMAKAASNSKAASVYGLA